MLPFCEKGKGVLHPWPTEDPQHKRIEHIEQLPVDPTSPYLYDLFAVVIHIGGAYGGHYHAYIRNVLSTQRDEFIDENRLTLESIF